MILKKYIFLLFILFAICIFINKCFYTKEYFQQQKSWEETLQCLQLSDKEYGKIYRYLFNTDDKKIASEKISNILENNKEKIKCFL